MQDSDGEGVTADFHKQATVKISPILELSILISFFKDLGLQMVQILKPDQISALISATLNVIRGLSVQVFNGIVSTMASSLFASSKLDKLPLWLILDSVMIKLLGEVDAFPSPRM